MKWKGLAIVLLAQYLQILCCKAQTIVARDTALVIGLNRKAFEIRTTDLELSKKYATQAIMLAKPVGYSKGLSYSYNIFGNYYKVKGAYDSSLFYYTKSLRIRQELRDTLNIARSYRNVMTVENLLENNEKAISTGLKAVQLFTSFKTADPAALEEKAWLENHLGYIYMDAGQLMNALQLIHTAKKLFISLENESGQAAAGMNLALVYVRLELYGKALGEYRTLLPVLSSQNNQEELAKAYNGLGDVYYRINDYQLALIHYRQNLAIKQKYGFTGEINGVLLNMGIIYETLGKQDSALRYYEQALDLSLAARDSSTEEETRWALGTLLYNQNNFKQALGHLLLAKRLSAAGPISAEDSYLFKDLSKAYSALGNPDSALYYSNLYTKVNDSLNEILRKSLTLEYTINDHIRTEEISKEKGRQRDMIIFSITLAFILLLIIFFLYYRFMRSRKNMQELRELLKDKELKALDAMLEGQQEERKRLAVELHDTIGSMLSATKYSFKAMEKSFEKIMQENKAQYLKINTMLDETMDSVRRISHNMAAGIFAEKGLEGALAELCATFEEPERLKIHLNVHGFGERLDYTIEVNLYRIVQELLTNIIKHAQAGSITIQLIHSDGNINLVVEDDGRGFDPEEARRKKGIGLSNVDQRVKKLSGSWNIDSGRGRGTTVIIDIPVNETT